MTAPTLTRGSLLKIRDETVYYDHQIKGIRQMAKMGSLLLCDEMGLGKSVQALTVAAIDFQRSRLERSVLIVVPASLKYNWAAEIERFTLFSYAVLEGTPKQRQLQLEQFDRDILVVNYEQVASHLTQINSIGFQVVILDEAHYIKGYQGTSSRNSTKRGKAIAGLKGKRFMLLTGSPLLNHVNDLWALLNRIDPHQFPHYYKFVTRYAVFGGFKDKQIIGVKHEAELKGKISPVMIRRLKKDVLDLPEKQYIPIVVGLHPEQAKLYRQARDDMLLSLPDNPDPMELENVLVRFLKLKQICGTTATIEGYPDHSYKLDRAVEIVNDIHDAGEHVVVWTQFRGVMAAMENRLAEAGIYRVLPGHTGVSPYLLNGDVPTNERVDRVKAWADGPPMPLMCMLQVGGVGLNMTAASKTLFLDKLYVPKLNEQAEDRLHRIGADLTKAIQILHVYCKGTIEDRIEQILRTKNKVFDTVVEDSDWKRKLYAAIREEDDL